MIQMKRNAAFTLVEMMIATAILSVIIFATMVTMTKMSDQILYYNQAMTSQQNASRTLELVAESMRSAQMVALNANGDSSVTFQVPVDADGDLDFIDDTLNVEWGARRDDLDMTEKPAELLGASTMIQFTVTGTFNEATRGVDLNGDNDTVDVFDVGTLTKRVPGGTTTAYVTGSDKTKTNGVVVNSGTNVPATVYTAVNVALLRDVIRVQGQTAGDVDGDGDNDPIFNQSGAQLQINVFVARVEEAEPYLTEMFTSIDLSNQ